RLIVDGDALAVGFEQLRCGDLDARDRSRDGRTQWIGALRRFTGGQCERERHDTHESVGSLHGQLCCCQTKRAGRALFRISAETAPTGRTLSVLRQGWGPGREAVSQKRARW